MLPKLRTWYRSTFGLAALGAILLWAALPPVEWFPLGWFAPIPWIVLIRRRELAGRRPYRVIWLAGFLFWLAALHWLRLPHWLTSLGWLALAFYLAFYLPVFVGLARVAVHRLRIPVILAAPVVWTGLELARGHLLGGFTMASLGHTQYRWIELIQLSDLGGAYGVGFVVMAVAACLGRMIRTDRAPAARWPLVPLVAVLAATVLYGEGRIAKTASAPDGQQIRVLLVQGSIDTRLDPEPGARERTHQQYRELTEEAIRRCGEVDLIVWPETVFGYPLFDYREDAPPPDDWTGTRAEFEQAIEAFKLQSSRPMAQMALALKSSLLVGVSTTVQEGERAKRFNSAAFVDRAGRLRERYDKMHLVMFGEYVPFADRIAWLERLVGSLCPTAAAGDRPVGFELGGVWIAPNICFESVIPHLIRGHVTTLAKSGREPDVLINLTNDGWFWGSSELDMHLICGVFRAVECRKPLLIAANTGFSAWIDADGRILERGPRRATGTILAEVGPDSRRSWYLDHGDLPAGLCLAGCLVLGLVGCVDCCKSMKIRLGPRKKKGDLQDRESGR
jgi:apolipoprotein N-acyltransferase